MFCSEVWIDEFCVCFAMRHVLVSLYLMGLYQWVFFFGKSSNGGFEFGHGFGYGHGFFILCVFLVVVGL